MAKRIAAGAKWQRDLAAKAFAAEEERIRLRKEQFRALLRSVSRMRLAIDDAQKAVDKYLAASDGTAKTVAEELALTATEKRMLFGKDVLAELSDDEDMSADAASDSGPVSEPEAPETPAGGDEGPVEDAAGGDDADSPYANAGSVVSDDVPGTVSDAPSSGYSYGSY